MRLVPFRTPTFVVLMMVWCECDSVKAHLDVADDCLQASREELLAAPESLELNRLTSASFHLRLEADLKASFHFFRSRVTSVPNGSLETHRSDLVHYISDTSDVLERVSWPIIQLLRVPECSKTVAGADPSDGGPSSLIISPSPPGWESWSLSSFHL